MVSPNYNNILNNFFFFLDRDNNLFVLINFFRNNNKCLNKTYKMRLNFNQGQNDMGTQKNYNRPPICSSKLYLSNSLKKLVLK